MVKAELRLPDGTRRSLDDVIGSVIGYAENYPAVFDLYDLPQGGPHNEVLPIDLLALNALNAFGNAPPMTAMTNAWIARYDIALMIDPITSKPLEELEEAQISIESEKVGAAMDAIDKISGYGSTATSKLFHRLRPNLGPIWDKKVGIWYAQHGRDNDWQPWVTRVYADVREPGTQRCLIAARERINKPLSLLRIWDLLLWQWTP